MGDETPPEGTPETPPETPPEGTPEAGFSIKLVDNIEDKELKAAMTMLLTQNAEMAKDNKEMKDIITSQKTERELAKFEKQRSEKMSELETLHPALAKKHAKTKDLGTLQTAIDTAKEFKSGFPEYETDKEGEEGSKKKNYVAPKKYKS